MNRALILLALMTPTAVNAQPFSQSMADCAAIHQNAAQWVETEATSDQLMYAARAWADAAIAQSAREGLNVSETDMWTAIDKRTETWEAKGMIFFLSEEFHDWSDYCRSFANNQGIVTTP